MIKQLICNSEKEINHMVTKYCRICIALSIIKTNIRHVICHLSAIFRIFYKQCIKILLLPIDAKSVVIWIFLHSSGSTFRFCHLFVTAQWKACDILYFKIHKIWKPFMLYLQVRQLRKIDNKFITKIKQHMIKTITLPC